MSHLPIVLLVELAEIGDSFARILGQSGFDARTLPVAQIRAGLEHVVPDVIVTSHLHAESVADALREHEPPLDITFFAMAPESAGVHVKGSLPREVTAVVRNDIDPGIFSLRLKAATQSRPSRRPQAATLMGFVPPSSPSSAPPSAPSSPVDLPRAAMASRPSNPPPLSRPPMPSSTGELIPPTPLVSAPPPAPVASSPAPLGSAPPPAPVASSPAPLGSAPPPASVASSPAPLGSAPPPAPVDVIATPAEPALDAAPSAPSSHAPVRLEGPGLSAEEKSSLPTTKIAAAAALVLVVGGGAAFFLSGTDESGPAKKQTTTQAASPASAAPAAPTPPPAPAESPAEEPQKEEEPVEEKKPETSNLHTVSETKDVDDCDKVLKESADSYAKKASWRGTLAWKNARKFLMRGKNDLAFEQMCISAMIDPKGPAVEGLVHYFLRQRAVTLAHAWAERGLEASPESRTAKEAVGDALSQLGRVDEARKVFLETAKLSADDQDKIASVVKNWIRLARKSRRGGDSALAERLLRRAASFDENNGELAVELATTLKKNAQPKLAQAWAEKALELDSSSKEAQSLLQSLK